MKEIQVIVFPEDKTLMMVQDGVGYGFPCRYPEGAADSFRGRSGRRAVFDGEIKAENLFIPYSKREMHELLKGPNQDITEQVKQAIEKETK